MGKFLIYFFIVFCVFYFKNIRLYVYTRNCFKIVKNNPAVKNKFIFKINDKKIENPRLSILGVLYFYVIIPPDIPFKFIDDYINSHFSMINEMFLEADLAGCVVTTRREFTTETDDKNYAENVIYKYLIKFNPIFWFGGFKKFFIFFIVALVSWLFLYKYNIHEYITIDNIKMVMSHIKDYFFTKQ